MKLSIQVQHQDAYEEHISSLISMKMFKYVNIKKLYSNMSTLCSKDGSPPRFPDEAPLMHQNYLVHVMMPLMMLQGIQVQKKGQYFDFSVTTKLFDVNACSQQVCDAKACQVELNGFIDMSCLNCEDDNELFELHEA